LASSNGNLSEPSERILGAEYDDALAERLMTALKRRKAVIVSGPERWLAGSQDFQEMLVEIDGQEVTVESETYIGLTIRGPQALIDALAEEIGVAV
jgi:hypothetical protein